MYMYWYMYTCTWVGYFTFLFFSYFLKLVCYAHVYTCTCIFTQPTFLLKINRGTTCIRTCIFRLKELNTGPGQSGPPAHHQSSPPYAPPTTSPSYNPPAFPPNPNPSPPYNPHSVTPSQHEQYPHQITPSPPTQAPLHSHTQPQVRPPPSVGGLNPFQWRDLGVPQGGEPSMAYSVYTVHVLFVCLTLLASFFLPSHLSFKNMYIHVYVHVKH